MNLLSVSGAVGGASAAALARQLSEEAHIVLQDAQTLSAV